MQKELDIFDRSVGGELRKDRVLPDIAVAIPDLPSSLIPIVEPNLGEMRKPGDYVWSKLNEQLLSRVVGLVRSNDPEVAQLSMVEPPPEVDADLAVACHRLARVFKKPPVQIAQDLAFDFNLNNQLEMVKRAEAVNGYLNLEIDISKFGNEVLDDIESAGDRYGEQNIGEGKTVVIDCSSPNIAKFMSVGHLRSTVIGEALARMYRAVGYRVIRDNHLGDWGTQFGILGRGIELWGEEVDREMPDAEPVQKLYALYVRMNSEIAVEKEENYKELVVQNPGADAEELKRLRTQTSSELEQQGRDWFRRLEEGDLQAKELLETTTAQSLEEFQRVYGLLGSNFEYMLGESFYVGMLPEVIASMKEKGAAQEDETGAVGVDVGEEKPLIVQKSDGASLYSTRDLATLLARTEWFDPAKIIYVVGGDQKDYFKQVFEAFRHWVGDEGPETEHVSFGMISLPEGKMSTRSGRVVFLEDVLMESIDRARTKILETDRGLTEEESEVVAKQVGVGSVVYFDLAQGRERDIKFDWDEALSTEGNSAAYIQYSHARGKAVLRRAQEDGIVIDYRSSVQLDLPIEVELIKHLSRFSEVVAKGVSANQPSTVAAFIRDTADLFNRFYNTASIAVEQDSGKRNSRLRLAAATSQVIKNGLFLLGIESPERM